MDRFSFPFVLTHFISAFFVIRSRSFFFFFFFGVVARTWVAGGFTLLSKTEHREEMHYALAARQPRVGLLTVRAEPLSDMTWR